MNRVSLSGRTVLVTGSARGLGRELALRLGVEERSNLILVDRDERALAQLAAAVSYTHLRAHET